ncbi:MAG: RDD family protein [Deltaproteobacteria bacterium]|nr:RDD family protein [Deltaproteobacteria bacterium]MBN2671005.1 RDD family protein [Deltaproteobacteria bacterium]
MSEHPNPYQPPRAPLGGGAERRRPSHIEPMEPATRGMRLLAAMLDGLATMMVLMPVMSYLDLFNRPMEMETQLTVFLLGFISVPLLHGYLLHTRGQSIGKLVVGIRIVGLDGRLLPLGRIVFMRYLPIQLANQIPSIGPLFAVMDVVWIFREDRRCIHDHIAGTMVVRVFQD